MDPFDVRLNLRGRVPTSVRRAPDLHGVPFDYACGLTTFRTERLPTDRVPGSEIFLPGFVERLLLDLGEHPQFAAELAGRTVSWRAAGMRQVVLH